MIVATFLAISKRKEKRQSLVDEAIKKLVLLTQDFDQVKHLLFSNRSDANIANQLHVSWKP
jgi:hypothetical protein